MQGKIITTLFFIIALYGSVSQADEINGSPFATDGAPLPQHLKSHGEKVIFVDPKEHAWGAYNANGKLIRWGIATAGASRCADSGLSCRSKTGSFRIYSLGNSNCVSLKYEGAPMPYCMYYHGGEALHGSNDVQFENISHGCVRIHNDDAKWLRYHFVEGPTFVNHYRGTKVIIQSY